MQFDLLGEFVGWFETIFEDNENLHMFALHLVGFADGGSLSDSGIANQTGLDLHRAKAMAADLDYVVDAPLYADEAIVIDGRGITRKVDIG